jgi:hypothetical protein
MQAMTKEGRTGYQMAYSQRDIDWLLKNGWTKVQPPEAKAEEPRKPGRPKLTLKDKP